MRILKITLILFSLLISGAILFTLIEESGNFSFTSASNKIIFAYFFIVLLMVFGVLNISYQIKTFRFYRKESKRNLDKKIPKFLWIAAISFNFFLFSIIAIGFYNNRDRYLSGNFKAEALLFMSMLFVFGVLGFLEISILKKRLKRLKTAKENKDEIETIGNIEV